MMLKTGKYRFDFFKTRYWEGANLTAQTEMPILKRNHFMPNNVISFTERNTKNKKKYWIDHFVDDVNFECVWNRLERYLPMYSKFAGVIGTDFSLYPNLPKTQCMWNCTRNRIIDYRLQSLDISVIPTASWYNKESLLWSLDGLPDNSSIAISTNGCKNNPYVMKIFLYGVKVLQAKKTPFKLIICGNHIKELDCYDNILYYQNFSQRWKERTK